MISERVQRAKTSRNLRSARPPMSSLEYILPHAQRAFDPATRGTIHGRPHGRPFFLGTRAAPPFFTLLFASPLPCPI